jgi:hypothetical protein
VLLLELTRVHPLLHAGAALLAFTALTAALSCGVLLATVLRAPAEPAPALPDWLLWGGDGEDFLFAMSASDMQAMLPPPPAAEAPSLLWLRIGSAALSVLTTLAAAAQLECHLVRCAIKPGLVRSSLLGAIAGVVAIAWSAMLPSQGSPLLVRFELASVLCTAAHSILVRPGAFYIICQLHASTHARHAAVCVERRARTDAVGVDRRHRGPRRCGVRGRRHCRVLQLHRC